jgi:sigma-B regulation protein RsbQ
MTLQTGAGVLRRNNVHESGRADRRPILFAHGFGCNQRVWHDVASGFEADHRVILFDHVGAGDSDLTAYDRGKYDSLRGYANDVREIVEELDLRDVVFVGHSVSALIGVLAANLDPSRFGALVLLSPSPRYVNDDPYLGGFEQSDIDELLAALDANYLDWSAVMAPVIMGNADRPGLGEELTGNFCSTDPDIAAHFARVTFLSDHRRDLADVGVPSLVLQSRDDAIAPIAVGEYVRDQIPDSRYVLLNATGHCANLSSPAEVTREIRSFLGAG